MSIKVEMTGNQTGFSRMLQHAEQEVKGFSSRLGNSWTNAPGGLLGGMIGAFSFESIKGFIEGIFDKAKDIRQTAEQFDLSTDSVQRWEKALLKAGISNQQFYRSIDMLRSKMEEGVTNPDIRHDFAMAGIGTEDMLSGDPEAVIKKLLTSGSSRPQINALLGRGGAKLGAALPYLSNAEPLYSQAEIEEMHNIESTNKGIWAAIWRGVKEGVLSATNPNGAYGRIGEKAAQLGTQAAKNITVTAQKRIDATEAAHDAINQQDIKSEEQRLKDVEKLRGISERIREADRRGMTPEQAKADRRKELKELQGQIGYYQNMIGPLSMEQMEKLGGLKLRQSQLFNESRETPPSIQADHLSRIGLYTASGINFNPQLNIAQQQLSELRGIRTQLAQMDSPHKP